MGYSRDVILHIKDKAALFEKFFKWLKPGGIVIISDYCCGDGEPSERLQEYVAQRGYHLLTPAEYGKVLESCGFADVVAKDSTDRFVEVLTSELTRTKASKDEFIADTSQEDYDAIVIVIYIRNVFIVQKLKVLHRLKGKHEKRYIQAGWVGGRVLPLPSITFTRHNMSQKVLK